jgi:DNA-directed RNA polymerase specialized sigma24 family protein
MIAAADDFTQLYVRTRPAILRAMRRSFSTTPEEEVADAVSQAFCDLLAKPAAVERYAGWGRKQLRSVLFRAAWCELRGRYRRSATRQEVYGLNVDARDWHQPLDEALHTRREVARGIREAADSCGYARKAELLHALRLRVYEEMSDTEAAREAGLPREYVNRG